MAGSEGTSTPPLLYSETTDDLVLDGFPEFETWRDQRNPPPPADPGKPPSVRPFYRSILFVFDPKGIVQSEAERTAPEPKAPSEGPSRVVNQTYPDDAGVGFGISIITVTPRNGIGPSVRELVHDVGHALGLSHHFVHSPQDLLKGGYRKVRPVPVMFPLPNDEFAQTPTVSDKAWFHYLYRGPTLASDYGVIWGHVKDLEKRLRDRLVVMAIPIDESVRTQGDGSKDLVRFSCISGFGTTTAERAEHGMYLLPVLSGRQYQLWVGSIPRGEELSSDGKAYAGFSGPQDVGPRIWQPGIANQYNSIVDNYPHDRIPFAKTEMRALDMPGRPTVQAVGFSTTRARNVDLTVLPPEK